MVTKVKKEVDSPNNKDFTALKMLENCPKDFNSFTICNMLLDAGARVEEWIIQVSQEKQHNQGRNGGRICRNTWNIEVIGWKRIVAI